MLTLNKQDGTGVDIPLPEPESEPLVLTPTKDIDEFPPGKTVNISANLTDVNGSFVYMSLFDRFKIGEFLNGNIDYYNHNMMLPVGCEYTNTVVMFHDYEAPMIFKRTTSQITKSDSDIIVDISGCNREVAIPDGVYESKLFEMGLATSTNSYNSTSLLEQYIDDAPIITFTVSGSRATINENTVVTLESGKWDIGLPDGPVNIIRALYRFPYNAITRKIE